MAIEAEKQILVTDIPDLGPDVPPEIKLLWDNNCLNTWREKKKKKKKHWAKMSSYYKKKRFIMERKTEICTCAVQYRHK